jgi:hypothetical protein
MHGYRHVALFEAVVDASLLKFRLGLGLGSGVGLTLGLGIGIGFGIRLS